MKHSIQHKYALAGLLALMLGQAVPAAAQTTAPQTAAPVRLAVKVGKPQATSPKIPELATRQGRYQNLLVRMSCPGDQDKLGDFYVYGPSEDPTGEYCGHEVPVTGYWVYVYPHWYIWGEDHLDAVGLRLLSHPVRLGKGPVKLEMAYNPEHLAWARTTLAQTAEVLKDLEHYSGKPFPGAPVFRLEEDAALLDQSKLGEASSRGLSLAPPDYSSSWTLMHESVHIWNSGGKQRWVREGLADVVGWLMMKENDFETPQEKDIKYYLNQWHELMETENDAPLEFDETVPDGKAIHFWLMIYELYGPDVLRQVFVASLDDKAFSVMDLAGLLKAAGSKDPAPLFSGWLKPGPYRVRKASDFGPIRYRLPDNLLL